MVMVVWLRRRRKLDGGGARGMAGGGGKHGGGERLRGGRGLAGIPARGSRRRAGGRRMRDLFFFLPGKLLEGGRHNLDRSFSIQRFKFIQAKSTDSKQDFNRLAPSHSLHVAGTD